MSERRAKTCMMCRRATKALLLTVVLAIGVIGTGGAAGADAGDGTQWWQSGDSRELTVDLNGQRNGHGRATLPADGVLSYWAEVHAAQMANAGRIYHQDLGPLMAITGCRSMAENVGYAPTVWGAHSALSYSAPHVANMVGDWRLVGVGVASRSGFKWVVEVFCTW
jgi:uncharacterized protein YkwD